MSAQPTFEEIVAKYRKFLSERNWGRKKPKSFAISMSLEANELRKHFQWSDDPVGTPEKIREAWRKAKKRHVKKESL